MGKGMGLISEMVAARSYLFNHYACEFLQREVKKGNGMHGSGCGHACEGCFGC